jgi:hypothetical protein
MPGHNMESTYRLPVAIGLLLLLSIAMLTGCPAVAPPTTTPAEPTEPGPVTGTPESTTPITPLDNPQIPGRGFYMGILPIPGEGQEFEDVYAQAARYAEFVPVWGRPTPYYGLAQELSGSWGKTFVTQLIRENGMFPLVHISFMDAGLTLAAPPGMADTSLSSSEWRASYKQAVVDVMRASRPLYLSAGNEVNRWYEKYGMDKSNPNGFQHFVSLYEEIYDEVKQLSPGTKVFCTFSREIVSEYREADLDVLTLFHPEKLDILVMTSYPYAVQGINRPSDIPDTYYAEAAALMPDKPIGFSELGWTSIDAFGGEQGQSEFLAQTAGRLTIQQGITPHLFGWTWLHDLDNSPGTGLITREGNEKLAYSTWKSISGRD